MPALLPSCPPAGRIGGGRLAGVGAVAPWLKLVWGRVGAVIPASAGRCLRVQATESNSRVGRVFEGVPA
jgi:hypothetical protein